MMNRKVYLPGHGTFWLIDHYHPWSGALAPMEDCTEDGYLISGDEYNLDYAHLGGDGVIRKHHQVIGRMRDLVEIDLLIDIN